MEAVPHTSEFSALFEKLRWRDPQSGRTMIPMVGAKTPGGGILSGALQIEGTTFGYPIVDGIARITPSLAFEHRDWLLLYGLTPPPIPEPRLERFQEAGTVESFGFQWSWNSNMRNEEDLLWRVASRFNLDPNHFKQKRILDAGCGAGDQSRWLIDHGAQVISIDLSAAIEVTARKLRNFSQWVGIQGDITNLPFDDATVDGVYCEGVIQHTQNSERAVKELCRVTKPQGIVQATHYPVPMSVKSKIRHRWQQLIRSQLSKLSRFPLLFACGLIAFCSYLPLLGRLMRKSGTAIYSTLMPDFKTTWTNTYDYYGAHSFQRYISSEDFRKCFEVTKKARVLFQRETLILAQRIE